MDEEGYKLQEKWIKSRDAKIEKLKAETEKPPSFKPHIYTSHSKPKKVDGHVADLTVKAGANYANRQAKARQEKQQHQERFDKLGSVHHSKNKSLAVVLPVELSSTHHTHDGRAATCAGENTDGGNGLDEFTASGHGIAADFPEDNGKDFSEEETLVEMLQRERREWHDERTKLVHCIHIQQLELMQRASASQERASDIAKEFARAIEGFEERLYAVESNVQNEIIAIKQLAENIKSSAVATSNTTEDRLKNVEKGIDIIISRLNDSTQLSLSSRNK